jgi:hypothetical protein
MGDIYDLNNVEGSVAFGHWMVDELPNVHGFFCRDFNMVKTSNNREGLLPIRILQGKLVPFNDLKPSLVCITPTSSKDMYHQNYGLVE